MKEFDIMHDARQSAEILREEYDVPIHRATVLEYAALGAAKELEAHGIEVTYVYVTNELVAGDELGIRIETNMMVVDIQAYPKDGYKDVVSRLTDAYGSPEGLAQAIDNDYKEVT